MSTLIAWPLCLIIFPAGGVLNPGDILVSNFNNAQNTWDFTVDDEGNRVHVFVSNSITGAISRLDLAFNGRQFSIQGAFTIASGYTHHADPATFEVSPTGLAYDRAAGQCLVADGFTSGADEAGSRRSG